MQIAHSPGSEQILPNYNICLQQILQLKQSSKMNFTRMNFIRLLRVIITPSEGAITTRSNRMIFSLEFYQFSQIKSLARSKKTQEDHFPLNLQMGPEDQKSALL